MAILNNSFFSLIGFKKRPKAPWAKYYGRKNLIFEVPNISIYEFIYKKHFEHEDHIAIEYYGRKYNYTGLFNEIDKCTKALKSYGIRKGDVITILSANIPEALFFIFAINPSIYSNNARYY